MYLDNYPLLPLVYIADTRSPVLLRWFLDRSNFASVVLFFDEPVTVNRNASYGISIGFPPTPANTNTLIVTNVTYLSHNTEVVLSITLPPYLISVLSTETTSIYFLLAANSVYDFAVVPNGNAALAGLTAQVEGSPGMFARYAIKVSFFNTFVIVDCSGCPTGYYTSTSCTLHSDRICSPCGSW